MNKGRATPKRSAKGGFTTILVLLVVVLVGGVGVGWYLSNTGVIPKFSVPLTSEQPPAPPSIPDEDETTNWKTYTNKELGIQFNYPPEWGELVKQEEPCLVDTGGTREYQGQPCIHVSLSKPADAGLGRQIFLASQSKMFAKHGPGRGAYFGDTFTIAEQEGIDQQEFVEKYCTIITDYQSAIITGLWHKRNSKYNRCGVQRNTDGILYAKSFEAAPKDLIAEEKDNPPPVYYIYYLVYHPDHPFPGVILSTDRFSSPESVADQEKIFDQILSTFKFLP